ncbi:MAG: hypothetical protein ACK44W_15530 [Planctomycetota bacterium]
MAYNNRAVALGDPGRPAEASAREGVPAALKKALEVAPPERLPWAKVEQALQRTRPEEGENP